MFFIPEVVFRYGVAIVSQNYNFKPTLTNPIIEIGGVPVIVKKSLYVLSTLKLALLLAKLEQFGNISMLK